MLKGTAKKKNHMSAEKNLDKLLESLSPLLHEGEYVFCQIDSPQTTDLGHVLMLFREAESVTLVVRKEFADQAGWTYPFVASWITLEVYSSLDAVGLTAAVSGALAEASISCNVVAAYNHDHLFINNKDAGLAMEVLRNLSVAKRS